MVFCPGNIAQQQRRGRVSEGTWGVKEQQEDSSPAVTTVLMRGPVALSQPPEGQGTRRGPERPASKPSTARSAGGVATSGSGCSSEAPELGTEVSNPQEVDRTCPGGARQEKGHLWAQRAPTTGFWAPGTEAAVDVTQGHRGTRSLPCSALTSRFSLPDDSTTDLTDGGAGLGWRWLPGH